MAYDWYKLLLHNLDDSRWPYMAYDSYIYLLCHLDDSSWPCMAYDSYRWCYVIWMTQGGLVWHPDEITEMVLCYPDDIL